MVDRSNVIASFLARQVVFTTLRCLGHQLVELLLADGLSTINIDVYQFECCRECLRGIEITCEFVADVREMTNVRIATCVNYDLRIESTKSKLRSNSQSVDMAAAAVCILHPRVQEDIH